MTRKTVHFEIDVLDMLDGALLSNTQPTLENYTTSVILALGYDIDSKVPLRINVKRRWDDVEVMVYGMRFETQTEYTHRIQLEQKTAAGTAKRKLTTTTKRLEKEAKTKLEELEVLEELAKKHGKKLV